MMLTSYCVDDKRLVASNYSHVPPGRSTDATVLLRGVRATASADKSSTRHQRVLFRPCKYTSVRRCIKGDLQDAVPISEIHPPCLALRGMGWDGPRTNEES